MSATVGGSIQSVAIRSRLFAVASDADAGIKLGGSENEVQANGNGSARLVKVRVPWSTDAMALSINTIKGDLEFLQEIANLMDFVPMEITLANNTVYQARGMIVGEIKMGTNNATAPITLSGPGEATRQ